MSIFDQSRANFSTPQKVYQQVLSLLPCRSGDVVPVTWSEFHDLVCPDPDLSILMESDSPTSFKNLFSDDHDLRQLVSEFPILSTPTLPEPVQNRDSELLRILTLIYHEMSLDTFQAKTAKEHLARYVNNVEIDFSQVSSNLFPISVFSHLFFTNPENRLDLVRASHLTLAEIDNFTNPTVSRLVRQILEPKSETQNVVPTIPPTSRSAVLSAEFPSDSRGQIVIDFLETSKPSDLPPVAGSGDMEQLKQKALLINAQRMVARPFGRGALTLGLSRPQSVEEAVSSILLSPICLNGKFSGSTASVSLDLTLFPIDALYWPEFHNGVANTLEMFFSHPPCSREWILGMKARVESLVASKRAIHSIPLELLPLTLNRHAGFLFGLALSSPNGLNMLRIDDCYRYLKLQNECISIAVILGRSLGKLGTSNPESAKLCLVHITSEIAPHSNLANDLEISLTIQAAALAGLGIVFANTANQKTMELLLKEIGYKPLGDKPTPDRECYSVCAGIGLGLVGLGRGDSRLANKLLKFIQSDGPVDTREVSTTDNSARCSVLFEPCSVNRSITLPGACIALALAFLQTNDASVASRIRIPTTSEQLEREQVRADSLLFQYLTRSLILWDKIDASKKWIDNELVEFLRNPNSCEHKENRQPGDDVPSSIDWLQVYQSRMYAISGLCMAIGLKYAGTWDVGAKNLLVDILRDWLVSVKWPATHCAAQSASRPSILMNIDRATIETCRATVLLSLVLITVGSGDLEVLRLARIMRKRADDSTQFGISSAVDLALGILFLGGGRLAFSNTKLSIAFLLITILPRYPSSVSDNKFLLQAFRHLYVLAVEDRRVELVDAETRRVTRNVPAVLKLKDGSSTTTHLPNRRMPRPEDIQSIEIVSDRFYPLIVDGYHRWITVERLPGKQTHDEDPTGNLNADKAYISGFTCPNETEVHKLLGLPLQSDHDTHRFRPGCVPLDWIDEGNCAAPLAAISLDQSEEMKKRLTETAELVSHFGDKERLKVSEKYSDVLVNTVNVDERRRRHQLAVLHECIANDTLDEFFNLIN